MGAIIKSRYKEASAHPENMVSLSIEQVTSCSWSPEARCNLGSFTQARQKARAHPKEKDQVSKSTWKLVAKIQLSIPPFNLNLFNKLTPAMHRD